MCATADAWAYNLPDADGTKSFGWMVLGVVMATLSLILVSMSSRASGEQDVDYEPKPAPPVQMLALPAPAAFPEKQLELAGARTLEEVGQD